MASDTQQRLAAIATPHLHLLLRDWPSLAQRLARADHRRDAPIPLEDWLLRQAEIDAMQVGALRAQTAGLAPARHGWLRVDARTLHVSGDHLIALPWRADDAPDAALLLRDVLPALQNVGAVHILDDCALIDLDAPTKCRFEPPWRAENRPIDSHLPQGPDGGLWRRWLTEAQMLLHQHPLNEERATRGRSPLNGLWLSGGDASPAPLVGEMPAVLGAHRLGSSLPPASPGTVPSIWSHAPGETPPEALRWLETEPSFQLEVLAGEAWHRFVHRGWHRLRVWRREVEA